MRDFHERDGGISLRADQDRFIADVHFMVSHVDHELVHADGADNGEALAVDEHVGAIGKATPVSIAISDGDGDDARLPFSYLRMAVTDPLALRDHFKIGHFGFQREARSDLFPGGWTVFWEVSKGDKRRAHHIQASLWEEERASRVCHVADEGCVVKKGIAHKIVEGCDLFQRKGIICAVGCRKMRFLSRKSV